MPPPPTSSSNSPTSEASCASTSPTTAEAAPTPRAPACAASPAGSTPSTAPSPCTAPPADPPASRWRSRAACSRPVAWREPIAEIPTGASVRVVIAEDLFLLRDGLVRMLEAFGFEVLAAVDNGPDLARALEAPGLDVAVVDVRLPPTQTDEGLRCALAPRRARPGLPILFLSQHVEQL